MDSETWETTTSGSEGTCELNWTGLDLDLDIGLGLGFDWDLDLDRQQHISTLFEQHY